MEQKLPAVVITNYQQYINAGYLVEMLLQGDDLKGDSTPLYASVAYVDVKVKNGANASFVTVLALSIKGKTYTYKHSHYDTDYYLAKKGLDVNNYGTIAGKDNHIRVFQKAFEDVVSHFIEKIAMDIALNQ